MAYLALIVMLMTGCAGGQELTAKPASVPPTPTPSMLELAKLAELEGSQGPVYSLAWSPDGNVLAAAGYGQVKLWNAGAGEELKTLEGHTSYVWGVAWSPNGSVLASASEDGTVRLWDAKTYEESAVLETGWAFCVAWSPDGQVLASAHQDGKVRLWNVVDGEVLHTLGGHAGWVRGVAWSPDGRRLASTSEDRKVRLWDAETGQRLVTLNHSRAVWSVAWSPDGSRLAAGSGAYDKITPPGKVVVWAMPSAGATSSLVPPPAVVKAGQVWMSPVDGAEMKVSE